MTPGSSAAVTDAPDDRTRAPMPITLAGADEAAWRRCRSLCDAPEADWGPVAAVVVVAPHPDDEVLAIGGTLSSLHRQGAAITMVAVTDGEAARPEASSTERHRLADVRAAERRSAARCLGLGSLPVHRLKLPDGGVAQAEGHLVDRLAELGPAGPIEGRRTLWIAPWRHDGHPDHEASGRAAAAASRRTGGRLIEFPVWAWQWLSPDDHRFPWGRLRLHRLPPTTRAAKSAALDQFPSQTRPQGTGLEPILAATMLARFHRPFEGLLIDGRP